MKRKLFLQKIIATLCAFPFIPRIARSKTETGIRELEENYCIAANALRDYRRKNGFEPSVRVHMRAPWLKSELTGTIPKYGKHWCGISALSVPVLRDDNGNYQPWLMSDLTIIA